MPEVYNWQLGRMMTYIYDEKHTPDEKEEHYCALL